MQNALSTFHMHYSTAKSKRAIAPPTDSTKGLSRIYQFVTDIAGRSDSGRVPASKERGVREVQAVSAGL